MIRLDLDGETLARLYPAYIRAGSDGTIRSAGPALRRIAGEAIIGAALADLIDSALDLATAARSNKSVQLRLRDPALTLMGEVVAVGTDYLLALRIVPDRSWPLDLPLQIADFAPSDPVVAAIMQSGIQAALLDESRAMALDLAAERARVMDLLGRISRASAHTAHEFNNLISIIGLNCERLLREHAGDTAIGHLVEIIRDTAQRGSEMTQSLLAQLTPGAADGAGANEVAPAAFRSSAPARVLVVDDEPHALEALEELLTDYGFAVTACAGADAALTALAVERFDILLTDVVMPDISGIELARASSQLDVDCH